MGSVWGYGVCMGLWGLYEAMESMRGYGVYMGLWGLHGAMGLLCGSPPLPHGADHTGLLLTVGCGAAGTASAPTRWDPLCFL